MNDEPLRYPVDDHVTLVPLQRELAPALFNLTERYRDDLVRWLSWPGKVQQLADTERYIARMVFLLAQRQAMQFVVEVDGVVAGVCGFNKWSQPLARGELGYWLAPPWRGSGIITRCCRWLCTQGFDVLGLQELQIAVASGNHASQCVCQRLGMQQYKVIEQAEELAVGMVDHVIYRLSRSQWESLCRPF